MLGWSFGNVKEIAVILFALTVDSESWIQSKENIVYTYLMDLLTK